MRLIDADALWVAFCRSEAIEDAYGSGVLGIISDILDDMLTDAPTVDAVPVVRCKDCKRFAPDKDGGDWGMCTDEGSMMLTQKDFGCLGGERKEDSATD